MEALSISQTPPRKRKPARSEQALRQSGSTDYWRQRREREAAERSGTLPARDIPKTPSGPTIRTYCAKLIPGYDPRVGAAGFTFSPTKARAAILWFHTHLTHIKGELGGKAFRLEPWQMAIVGNLFGWHDKAGKRRYRQTFIFVPQKNGKTPFAGGLALYMLDQDREPGAEIYSAAFTREQAGLVWKWARGMAANDADLLERFHLKQHAIEPVADPNAFYRTIAAKEQGAHGANAHGVIIDEEHTFDRTREEVIETLEAKTAARSQPLIVKITTAGWDRESICYKDYTYAKQVRDGTLPGGDPRFLPVIWEAGPDDDWTDEAVWEACNPNYGVSVRIDDMREACKKAQGNPRKINRFRQLRLNQWTEQEEIWIPSLAWDDCATEFDEDGLYGRECYGGLDVGLTTDHTALALVFPGDDGLYQVLAWHWMPRGDIREKSNRDRVDYLSWEAEGWITLTAGDITDFARLRSELGALLKDYDVRHLAYDPWRAGELTSNMKDQDGLPMVEHRQGYISMSPPCKEFERLVLDRKLRHNGNPLLRWNVANAAIDTDPAGNIKPNKNKANGRIDGMVATIMAVGLATTKRVETVNPYSDHGIRTLDL